MPRQVNEPCESVNEGKGAFLGQASKLDSIYLGPLREGNLLEAPGVGLDVWRFPVIIMLSRPSCERWPKKI